MDARTGVTRDTFLLPFENAASGIHVPSGGWMWSTVTGRLMVQRPGDQSPHVVPLPDSLGLVSALATGADGRRLAFLAHRESAPDSTEIVVTDADGGNPVVWARVRGSVGYVVVGDTLIGFIQGPSIYALDGPGHVKPVGTVPTTTFFSVSADLKRVVFTTSEYRGDAWLTTVRR